MKTEYSISVLQTIRHQEFYNEVEDNSQSEVFDDILDFMLHYDSDWLINLGEWASEFIQHHVVSYEDLYEDEELSSVSVLTSLYWDLDEQYKQFVSDYKLICNEQAAYRYEYNLNEEGD